MSAREQECAGCGAEPGEDCPPACLSWVTRTEGQGHDSERDALDRESSASRGHYIETGQYLTRAQVAEYAEDQASDNAHQVVGETLAVLELAQRIETASVDRDTTIAELRTQLRARTGRVWSVKGQRGTAWGWIDITTPPRRRVDGRPPAADVEILVEIFGHMASSGTLSIAASRDHYREALQNAHNLSPEEAQPYWD